MIKYEYFGHPPYPVEVFKSKKDLSKINGVLKFRAIRIEYNIEIEWECKKEIL